MRTRLLVFACLLIAAVAGVLTAGDKSMSYIYRRGDNSYTRLNGSLDRIGEVSRRYGGEFVWVRWNGRSHVIRDAATLAEIREAFREIEALEPSLRDVEKRLKPFENQIETIESRIDSYGDQLDDEHLGDSTRDAIEAKLRDAENAMREVERRMSGIEREMEQLERKVEKLEEVAEERFEKIVKRAIGSGVAERVD